MIYDSVDVRISVSNKGHVGWGGGGKSGHPGPPPPGSATATWMSKFRYPWGRFARNFGKNTAQESKQIPLTVDMRRLKHLGFPQDQPGPRAFSPAPLSARSLGKSLWVTSQLTEESRIDWVENAWGPGITRGRTSCQRSQNVETLLTIQYHLSLRVHFRFRYLLLDLLLLRWTEKAWLESLPAVLDSTWKIRWQQKCQVMHESVEYDRPGEFLDTPAISTQLSTSFSYYKCF